MQSANRSDHLNENRSGSTRFLVTALIGLVGLDYLPTTTVAATVVVDFGDLSLSPSSYWCGPDPNGTPQPNPDPILGSIDQVGKFASGGVNFENRYSLTYQTSIGVWEGFSYSNIHDTTTPDFTNQFAAIAGSGINGPGSTYAIGFEDWGSYSPTLTLPSPTTVLSADFTNSTYAYYSMLNGDQFAKKFTSSDTFKLTISASDTNGQPTGTPVNFYLADGTNFVTNWTKVDLTSLGNNVKSLEFDLTSSDIGQFGMNTPAYFAMGSLSYLAAPTGPGSLIWTGSGNGTWSQPADWGGNSFTGSQAITFSGSNRTTSVNDLPPSTQVNSVTFTSDAAAFMLSGSGIRLAGNLINSSTCTETIDLGIELVSGGGTVATTAGNLVINGNISGSKALTKSGSATLILAGSNDYAGGTIVLEGTLVIQTANALLDGSALIVGSNATSIFGTSSSSASAVAQATAAAVPEPGMLMLLATGGLAVFIVHFFRRYRCVG